LESVSKSKSKSAHSSPPQTKSTGDHRESTKAAQLEQRNPKEFQRSNNKSNKKNQQSPIRIKDTNSKNADEKIFLKQMHTRADYEKVKKMRPKTGKATDPATILLNKKIELSQMSEWTDRGTDMRTTSSKGKQVINPKTVKAVNEKEMNSKMDREGLKHELMQYKRFSLQQYEQIRLLKVEIAKIRKIAHMKELEAREKEDKKASYHPSSSENPGWVTNQDSALLRPKDYKALQKELSVLK